MMNDDECGAIVRMIGRETEGLGGNLSHCLFVHHKSYIT
jgi:hypothetical protein